MIECNLCSGKLMDCDGSTITETPEHGYGWCYECKEFFNAPAR